MMVSRKRALAATVDYLDKWPTSEIYSTINGWDFATIHSSHGLLAEIILMSDGEDQNITEQDWLAAKGETPEPVNEPLLIDIYTMKLHDEMTISDALTVTRVPGGWLYHDEVTTTFIQYNKEFSQL